MLSGKGNYFGYRSPLHRQPIWNRRASGTDKKTPPTGGYAAKSAPSNPRIGKQKEHKRTTEKEKHIQTLEKSKEKGKEGERGFGRIEKQGLAKR